MLAHSTQLLLIWLPFLHIYRVLASPLFPASIISAGTPATAREEKVPFFHPLEQVESECMDNNYFILQFFFSHFIASVPHSDTFSVDTSPGPCYSLHWTLYWVPLSCLQFCIIASVWLILTILLVRRDREITQQVYQCHMWAHMICMNSPMN